MGRLPGDHEDPGADDTPDPETGQLNRTQRPAEAVVAFDFPMQLREAFPDKKVLHGRPYSTLKM
jgi:hypothetical protein